MAVASICSFYLGLAMQHPKEKKIEKKILIPQPGKGELIDQRANVCSSLGYIFFLTAISVLTVTAWD